VVPTKRFQDTSVAERKAAAFLEKERVKEHAKFKSLQLKNANALVNKLRPILANLDTILNHPNFALIAKPFADPVKEWNTEFSDIHRLCNEVIGGDDDEAIPDPKDVQVRITLAKKHIAMLTPMLGSIDRGLQRLHK